MSLTHKHRQKSRQRERVVVGETKREDLASSGDIEIRSGGDSILDLDVHPDFEDIRNFVVEDLMQDIAQIRKRVRY